MGMGSSVPKRCGIVQVVMAKVSIESKRRLKDERNEEEM
jgi:hypothetical protein